jgi:peptidoglycan/LPS O-acetylase OafA/YrhL
MRDVSPLSAFGMSFDRHAAAADDAGSGYRPDLDGLRAIAVGLVMLSHANWPWVNNGGDAGVTAFFVLSGYLITNLLGGEHARRGTIDVVAFYRRRFIRLAPALLGVMGFALLVGLLIGWQGRWQVGLVSCLLYVSNWVQVAGVPIQPLGHTWSLAIEEQFYLVWPALLILLRGRILAVAIVAVLVASVIRVATTGEFEYFSTITRADAILVGAIVALVRPKWHPSVAVGGLVALLAIALLDPAHDVAIPAAMIAATAVIVGRFGPLGYLAPVGLRAYSLYLWNWPMTILFGSIGLLAPLLTILVAEVSFRLLEAPFLRRGPLRDRRSPIAPPARPSPAA